MEPADLPGISRGNPFRATALPFTRCVVCKLSLNDLYKGDRTVLVLGQCLAHGIWIERGDLEALESVYADVMPGLAEARIRRAADTLAARREHERREQQARALAELPEILQQLVRRVELLEHQVAQLKLQLAERG